MGSQEMAHHYHVDLGKRLAQAGSLDAEIPRSRGHQGCWNHHWSVGANLGVK